MTAWKKMTDEVVESVIRKCQKYKFTYHVVINGIFIRTNTLGGWYIQYCTDDEAILYHENYRKMLSGKSRCADLLSHYHKQTSAMKDDGSWPSAAKLVDYIAKHDKKQLWHKKKKNKCINKK